jgi:hypothetical protein
MDEDLELLSQIAALMEQYLASPEDTPLKATFEGILPEVQAAVGGGAGPEGALPPPVGPDMEGDPMDAALAAMGGGGQGAPPEAGGVPPEGDIVEPEGEVGNRKDYKTARADAMSELGAKDEESQPRKRKRRG